MAQESILEFRLGEEIYCFNTKIVKYVFDLEEYEELDGVDEAVFGIVRYESDAMLLIDTLFLYTHEKRMQLDNSKSVVVVEDENGALYGMAVDEILKIEDVEPASATVDLSSEELVIRHYKESDRLVHEVVPLPLLHAKKIPSFIKRKTKQKEVLEKEKREWSEYLIFAINEKLFALKTEYVKEVVEKESEVFELEYKSTRFKGAVAVREEVYKVANIKPLPKNAMELIVVQKERGRFCIEADRVFGIEHFNHDSLESLHDTFCYIEGFYNREGEVTAVLDVNFFIPLQKEKTTISKKEEKSLREAKSALEGFLIFRVGKRDFALDMKSVKQVVEEEDMPHASSSALSGASSHIAFLTEWNHRGIEVLALDRVLGVSSEHKASEVIIVQTKEKVSGVLVKSVEDIYYAKEEEIALSEDRESLISATLFKDDRVIAVLNPKRVIE